MFLMKKERKQMRHCGANLYKSIAEILRAARSNAYRAVNFTMVEAYWNVGRMIIEEEQQGKERAEYGAFLIRDLSFRLTEEFGKGFDERELRRRIGGTGVRRFRRVCHGYL